MDEPRLIDAINEIAAQVLEAAGAPSDTAQQLAEELVRKLCEQWGGDRHYVHRRIEDIAQRVASDPRPVAKVAQEHGVSRATVYRVRRRQLSSGVR